MKDDRRAAIMTMMMMMMMMMMAMERKLRTLDPSSVPPPGVLHNPEKSSSSRAWRGIGPKIWTTAARCVHCRREGPPVSRGIGFLQPAGGSISMMAGKYVLITLRCNSVGANGVVGGSANLTKGVQSASRRPNHPAASPAVPAAKNRVDKHDAQNLA